MGFGDFPSVSPGQIQMIKSTEVILYMYIAKIHMVKCDIGADEANMKLIFKFKKYIVVYMLQISFF